MVACPFKHRCQRVLALIKSDRQAFLSYLYSEYGQNDTKRDKSGDAVLEFCMHMLHATYREAMRNMETRVGEYMYCIQGPCMLYRETGLIQYVDR